MYCIFFSCLKLSKQGKPDLFTRTFSTLDLKHSGPIVTEPFNAGTFVADLSSPDL
jgi:hypothetical protein